MTKMYLQIKQKTDKNHLVAVAGITLAVKWYLKVVPLFLAQRVAKIHLFPMIFFSYLFIDHFQVNQTHLPFSLLYYSFILGLVLIFAFSPAMPIHLARSHLLPRSL